MNKQELASRIWSAANMLRKNISANEYKNYIIGFMFYKYLCDKEIDYARSLGGTAEDLKYADDAIKTKFKDGIGYFITYDNLFSTWKSEQHDNLTAKEVSEAIEDFYKNLNGRYKKVFDKVFSALQTGLDKLGDAAGLRDKAIRDIMDLVALIPPTSRNYDVLGYIYEYLIQQFSSEAKRDGAFYTPHEVTSLMARIVAERLKNRSEVSCYDPTVGSGGLLLNIGKEVGKYVPKDNIRYLGQELILETSQLCVMNLFMQGIPVQNIDMRNANTLEEDWPYFDDHTDYEPLFVDAVCSNPPYSAHYDQDEIWNDERFRGYGMAPANKADYAFLLHCLYHIKPDGIMAIVLPHGVLFRGDSEGEIRKNLILNHNIETIISLPSQLFFATGIPVVIMILSKNRDADDILFIDASQSYRKGKKQNMLAESDVQRIFDAVVSRKDIPNYAHLASMEEIESNDYNLNVPRYISAVADDTPYDLYSVMTGKVSDDELKMYDSFWSQFPKLREKLLVDDGGYSAFANVDFKEIIFADRDVDRFLRTFKRKSELFRGYLTDYLIQFKDRAPHLNGSETVHTIHDNIVQKLFADFDGYPLIDKYSVFQAFADNWETIEADLARIEEEGKQICAETEPHYVVKTDPKKKETIEQQKGWKGKVIPFDLVKSEFFSADFGEMSRLTTEADAKSSECTEIWENLEEDARAAVCKDEDESAYDTKKFKSVLKNGELSDDSVAGLEAILKAISEEKTLRKRIKDIESSLDDKAKAKIESLTEAEVDLLLEKKWIAPVTDGIDRVAENVLNGFATSLETVGKKYADPLSELSRKISEVNIALTSHLDELTGNDFDMKAILMLKEALK